MKLNIKHDIITVIFLVIIILSMNSCYYDKEEVLYPQTVCDTAVITYSQTIAPIISSFCNSCHGGTTPSAGIKLDTYTDAKMQVTNGRLWGAVSHATNYSPMPKNAPQLNACNLSKIRKWLDAGAPNN
jgi:hypothetical protein